MTTGIETTGIETTGIETTGIETTGIETTGIECSGLRQMMRSGYMYGLATVGNKELLEQPDTPAIQIGRLHVRTDVYSSEISHTH